MRIKHSKFKNTGLIYELLVKQITSDLVARKDSPAVNILRKYYTGKTPVAQEFGIYKLVQESKNLTTVKADNLVNASLKAARAINPVALKKQKYNLISEIRDSYNLEEFFSVPVADYKTLAALYCLMEADRSKELIDPDFIVNNKVTLLEHITYKQQSKDQVKDALIEEFSASEKDLRLLTFKILLEKFNNKYKDLLQEQKNVLKQVIALGSAKKLRSFVNEEQKKLVERLTEAVAAVPRGIERIKLVEAIKIIGKPQEESAKVTDSHLVRILQSYELLNELKKVL